MCPAFIYFYLSVTTVILEKKLVGRSSGLSTAGAPIPAWGSHSADSSWKPSPAYGVLGQTVWHGSWRLKPVHLSMFIHPATVASKVLLGR